MRVFLDFEASSLGDRSHPVEVAWVFEDGRREAHLIRPAPGWEDWSAESEAVHRISRQTLDAQGTPHDEVAQRMVEALTGHDLLASAPSWDGKWLSALLRAGGLPRHALRLRDTEEAWRETARETLAGIVPEAELADVVDAVVEATRVSHERHAPEHRALADALHERDLWLGIEEAARTEAHRR